MWKYLLDPLLDCLLTPLQFRGRENTIFASEFWVRTHPTSSHILSNGLDSVENVPLPTTANKKPEMIRCFTRYQTNQTPLTRVSLSSPGLNLQLLLSCLPRTSGPRLPGNRNKCTHAMQCYGALCSRFSIVARKIRSLLVHQCCGSCSSISTT